VREWVVALIAVRLGSHAPVLNCEIDEHLFTLNAVALDVIAKPDAIRILGA